MIRSALILTGIFVAPVVLLLTGIIPFHWRFVVLILMTLLAMGLAASRHSFATLGLTLPPIRSFLVWSVLPSAALIGAVLMSDLTHRKFTPTSIAFYAFYILVSAPAQEFLYRSFLFAELRALRMPPKAIVALSALLFAFMHLIYRDTATFGLTLVVGLIWALVFNSTHKVSIVAVSHAALGVASILAGAV